MYDDREIAGAKAELYNDRFSKTLDRNFRVVPIRIDSTEVRVAREQLREINNIVTYGVGPKPEYTTEFISRVEDLKTFINKAF